MTKGEDLAKGEIHLLMWPNHTYRSSNFTIQISLKIYNHKGFFHQKISTDASMYDGEIYTIMYNTIN